MPPALADDRKRQIAYDMAMSRVTDNLKDIIANGSKSVDSKGDTDKNIVPDVTDMYEAYASGIRKVCSAILGSENLCAPNKCGGWLLFYRRGPPIPDFAPSPKINRKHGNISRNRKFNRGQHTRTAQISNIL